MKKMLVILMAAALAVSASACGSSSENPDADADEAASMENEVSGTLEAAEEAEAEIDENTEVSTDKIAFDFDEPGEDSEEAEEQADIQEALESEDVPEVADAVEGCLTTESDPVPFGKWAQVQLYDPQDSTYHTVYIRVTKVTTQSEDPSYVDSAIEVNNAYSEEEDRYDPADQDIADDCELVVMDYEVYVPADFPSANYGMPEPKFYFSLRNYGGGGFPAWDGSVYLTMDTTTDLSVRAGSESYFPGNTYGERCIYVMVMGYTDYFAIYSSYPEGTTSDETSSDNMYTVYHSVN